MDTKVYIVQCPDYKQVDEKMAELFEMMGGIARFVREDENIILKANLLRAADPEKAVTTHPSIIAAIGRMAKAQGAKPVIADSPGSGYTHSRQVVKRFYRKYGMDVSVHETVTDIGYSFASVSSIGFVHFYIKDKP